MVIRQLLDHLDKEIKSHKDAIVRIESLRQEIQGSCRAEKARRQEKRRTGCPEETRKRAA